MISTFHSRDSTTEGTITTGGARDRAMLASYRAVKSMPELRRNADTSDSTPAR